MSKQISPNTIARLGNGCPPSVSGSLVVVRGEVYKKDGADFVPVEFISTQDSVRAFRAYKKELENINIIYLITDVAKTMKFLRNPMEELLVLKKLRKEEIEAELKDISDDKKE